MKVVRQRLGIASRRTGSRGYPGTARAGPPPVRRTSLGNILCVQSLPNHVASGRGLAGFGNAAISNRFTRPEYLGGSKQLMGQVFLDRSVIEPQAGPRSQSQTTKGEKLVNGTTVPGLGWGSETRNSCWGPNERRLVAQPTEPEDPAPELAIVQSDGQFVQLR